MRSRDRLWLLLAPLLTLRQARAQPNTNAPSGGPGREAGGEVQVGAGTQGDVTTGSSGRKPGADTTQAAGRGRESDPRTASRDARGDARAADQGRDRRTTEPAAAAAGAPARPASPR